MLESDAAVRLGSTDCERCRAGAIAQPVNTVTSLAFVVAGGVVASRFRAVDRRTDALAYSSLLALVGAGSVAFHGPQPPGAKWMHDAPIAALAGLVVVTSAVRRMRGLPALPGWSTRRGATIAATSAAAIGAYAGGRTGAPTCRPDSLLQLHGAWHVLAAVGFTLVADVLFDDELG